MGPGLGIKYVAFQNEKLVKKAKTASFRTADSLAKFIYDAFFWKSVNFEDGFNLEAVTFFTEKLGKDGHLAFIRALTEMAHEIINFCDEIDLTRWYLARNEETEKFLSFSEIDEIVRGDNEPFEPNSKWTVLVQSKDYRLLKKGKVDVVNNKLIQADYVIVAIEGFNSKPKLLVVTKMPSFAKRFKARFQELLGDSMNDGIFNEFAWHLVRFNNRRNSVCYFKNKAKLSLDFKKDWLLLEIDHILEFRKKK